MIVMESKLPTTEYTITEAADPNLMIELIFNLHPNDQNSLENILNDVSNPDSSNYGKYLTKSEVDALVANPEGVQAVLDFLSGVEHAVSSQPSELFIHAHAPVSSWETVLHTKFHVYDSAESNQPRVIRTEQYSLPSYVAKHVNAVFNTVQFPVKMNFGPRPIPIPLKKINLQDLQSQMKSVPGGDVDGNGDGYLGMDYKRLYHEEHRILLEEQNVEEEPQLLNYVDKPLPPPSDNSNEGI